MKALPGFKFISVALACLTQTFVLGSCLSGQVSSSAEKQKLQACMEKYADEALSQKSHAESTGWVFRSYEGFINSLHKEYAEDQRALANGNVPDDYGWSRKGIRDDEEQAMKTLGFDTFVRLRAWYKSRLEAELYFNHHRQDQAAIDRLTPYTGEGCYSFEVIIQTFMRKLRLDLGNDDFKKVNEYVLWDVIDDVHKTRKTWGPCEASAHETGAISGAPDVTPELEIKK